MAFFKFFGAAGEAFVPVKASDDIDTLRERVGMLCGDETQAYKWVREFYSERWIAETLLLDRQQARKLIRSVCRKLGVKNVKMLRRVYSRLERPKNAAVNTDEIDRYVDERAGKETQEKQPDNKTILDVEKNKNKE